jgi:hypothetical protein
LKIINTPPLSIMKAYFGFILIVSIFISCQDNRVNSLSNSVDKNVGREIPVDVATRWKEFYRQRNSTGRESSVVYSVTSSSLKTALMPENKIGVAFHHSIDDSNVHHILLITVVKAAAGLWDSPFIIDANTNTLIDNGTAKAWAERYQNSNPGQIWYHFFGLNIFNEIISNEYFNYFNIEPALNDNGDPQLLLWVWNNKSAAGGRVNGYESPVVYDFSSPCPPCGSN